MIAEGDDSGRRRDRGGAFSRDGRIWEWLMAVDRGRASAGRAGRAEAR